VSPDGARIITGSRDRTAKVWDAKTFAELATLRGHTEQVESVAVSPDGARIVTGSWDNTAKVWDAETFAELATLKGHTKWITSVVVSPDGARIITGSADGTAKVWDAAWLVRLQGDALVRAVARARLVGEGRLSEDELGDLRPLMGEVDPDVVSRWLKLSPDTVEETEIKSALTQWRNHRDMSQALARKAWTARVAEIADLAKRHRRPWPRLLKLALLLVVAILAGIYAVDRIGNIGLFKHFTHAIAR
jgi:hypothetical protein